MDIQRVILIAALALMSYMLMLQWNQDYNTPVAEPTVATSSVSAYEPVAGDLPTANSNASADVPATATAAAEPVAAATDARLISVKTDTLELLIDPRGGDVIEAKLPQHLAVLSESEPLTLLEQNATRTYVAQSGLVGKNGPDANPDGRPLYNAEARSFELGEADQLSVDLNLNENGVAITKRFTFTRGSNAIKVEYLIDNQSAENFETVLFGQLKRDRTADPSQQTDMGMQSYLGAVFSTTENSYEKVDYDDMDDKRFSATSADGWVAMSQHYFLSAWVPEPGQTYTYQTRVLNGLYIAGYLAPAINVAPGQQTTLSSTLYAGPKDTDQLEQVATDLDLTIDYGILWFIASPLYMLLKWIYSIVGNWGLAIMGVTLVVKLALFHLNAKAFKSMAKMRKFGPEMARLKELYGDDRQKMSQEMMKLYSKEKINPLGGCLPIVAQMPIFIALYWVLLESVELRHAPFYGYIQDLSQMDPYFILPLLMGASMFVQQLLNPTPPDPMQAKIMKMLPIIFTFFFLWFPAGLVLYWVVNNVLSITQQYIINKQIEAGDSK